MQNKQNPYQYPGQQQYPPTVAAPQAGYPGQPQGQPQGYPPQGQQYPGYAPPYGSAYPGSAPPATGYPPTQPQGYPPQQPYAPPQGQGYPPQQTQTQAYPPVHTQAPGYPGQQTPGQPGQPGQPAPPSSQYPGQPTTGAAPYASATYPPSQQGGYPGAQTGYPGSYPPPQSQQQPGTAGQSWYNQYYNQLNQNDLSSLNAWFQSVDRDRSGEISVAELTSLNFNNRQLGPDLAKKLIAVFDKDHSGQINFQEYASLHQFLVSMQNAFNTADKSRRGFLDTNEVQTAIQMVGFQLSPTAVQHATRRFDTMKRGMLSWEEYLNLCAHLAYMRSIFEWSDSDRDGKVTFDYEQFIYATLYI